MRVLACGGRTVRDIRWVFREMDKIHDAAPITLLIEGGQVSYDKETGERYGADYLCSRWADSRQVPKVTERADWKAHGKNAGPRRNRLMLEKWIPERVVAFPGGKGTVNMIAQARAAGVEVILVKELIGEGEATEGRVVRTSTNKALP